MKELFDKVSEKCSKITTRSYSTSFSLGIMLFDKPLRSHIYNIYGFVRFADEIVDTFHDYDKKELLQEFRSETYKAINHGISLNPILNSFQATVNRFQIDRELIEQFLTSMAMDLEEIEHNPETYDTYILGSAEVVGLMCLRVFTNGDKDLYKELKEPAMKLGSAFQKINFLRDLKADYHGLGRTYFPNLDVRNFNDQEKREIENDIAADFNAGLKGIKKLPRSSRFGVYLAYMYYHALFQKIKNTKPQRILHERIRIPNQKKYGMILSSYIRYNLRLM